jgi:plastocyanin
MIRTTLVALAAAAALAAAGTAGAATPKLLATDGPGFTITLKNSKGQSVKTLTKGTYTIVVSDKSNIHNFHLTGPGLNKKTDVGFQGQKTWTVTLKAGTYKYVCDPHATTMKGSFKVS